MWCDLNAMNFLFGILGHNDGPNIKNEKSKTNYCRKTNNDCFTDFIGIYISRICTPVKCISLISTPEIGTSSTC